MRQDLNGKEERVEVSRLGWTIDLWTVVVGNLYVPVDWNIELRLSALVRNLGGIYDSPAA